jgi:hypothetical protein
MVLCSKVEAVKSERENMRVLKGEIHKVKADGKGR